MMDREAISDNFMPCLILVILSFLIPVSSNTPVTPNPLSTYCESRETNRLISNTPFERNLKTLLNNLTSSAPENKGYFYASEGVGSGQVQGQALCRGDVNDADCRRCLENASQEIIKECNKDEGSIWFERCQIYYSSREFHNVLSYSGKQPGPDYTRGRAAKPEEFGTKLKELFDELMHEAYNSSVDMFATGKIRFMKEKIYGLVQCTRDIGRKNCKSCLSMALGDLNGCCFSKEGGFVVSRNCDVRFELFRFYNTSKGHKSKKWKVVVVASCASSVLVILISSCAVYLLRRNGSTQDEVKSQSALLHCLPSPRAVTTTSKDDELVNTEELPLIDLATISAATDNFSNSNKLGQGGFGSVYKGVLASGKEVAVKRLSGKSWQGLEEFKNELILIAKLQHRNLVRLLGCAMEGEEKLLVYEFMPNKSLDSFIFDSEKRSLLDWKTRCNIINGIARGLLYLHEDSRLKVVHRDLKPSNVLLDNEMVSKISDFGLARIFCEDQNTANTRKVVGTYGYMAPEYAMEGVFSTKSDVFSFGVILLEIISGKRNGSSFHVEKSVTLIRYAWQLWKEGKELEFVDTLMTETCPVGEVIRCIHIGLLCVQEDPEDRPTMSSVVVLLESGQVSLPQPSQPAFCVPRVIPINQSSMSNPSVSGLITASSVSSST
ncbi:hypothetical protein TIFTF001_018952 [Ficus carica]|uniref:Uncharacterized protein n=1 Tax=Ficus carica TaxID=3494 RepID=A0AA88AW63_FICCA|nr:hypothetical protein TIFTF001_018952 [Ficus carica]